MTGLAVQNPGNTTGSYSGMLFYDQFNTPAQFQGFNNVTHEYRINNIASNASINFMFASASKFQVRSDGDIDIAGNRRKAGTLFLHDQGPFSLGVGEGALRVNTAFANAAAGVNAFSNTTTGAAIAASWHWDPDLRSALWDRSDDRQCGREGHVLFPSLRTYQ